MKRLDEKPLDHYGHLLNVIITTVIDVPDREKALNIIKDRCNFPYQEKETEVLNRTCF
ncbi:hypothetical protein [Acinetobacter sp. PK01]|uniref:hypothetical protein n=1 Tax=Acinetobacter sp. PK01 TaxID=2930198 RepID=UPI001FB5D352|nr:hypothetical protein [Acinetobacter sp. PK01]UOG18275.1 hypothetical protein MP622_01165 [Acinetobacter sp. PK01]